METNEANMIVHVMEAMEVGTGLVEEYGETATEMIRKIMGSDKANKMLIDMYRGFSSYVDDPKEVQRWYNIQKIILPNIDGLKVSTHKFDPGEPGACLYGEFGRYSLEVSIEDKEKLEDITYYDISVMDSKPGLDMEYVFHSGVLFDTGEIKRLIRYLQSEEIEKIIRLINAKGYDREKNIWVSTPECVMRELIDKAKSGIYTVQVTIKSCVCGKCNNK